MILVYIILQQQITMNETLHKTMRSSSLPRLQNSSLGMSKLFQNNDTLMQTKKIFLERLENKQQNKNIDDNENQKPIPVRSFIQFPKQTQQGFTSFKTINKNESQQIFLQLKRMRSHSTLLKPFIKAQIQFNKQQFDKIKQANDAKLKLERQYVAKRIKELTPNAMNKQVTVKEKFKNKVKNVKKINLKFNYKIYEQNLGCWKPYIDFDSMAVAIKQQIFFIGGRKPTQTVVYNAIQQSWKQLDHIEGMKCFGQTDPSVVDKKKILCFGGYYYFQQGFSLINNTLKTIDIKSMKFQVEEFPQSKAPCRAFHSQCIYGKFLIISGGVDKNSKLFSNFMNFNFQKKYWNQITVNKMPQRLKLGFAKHQALPIFHSRLNYSIYDNQPIIQKDESIKQQGIYIFGGQDFNAQLISTMYIMRLGQPSIVIQELQISGTAPVARRNTRMVRHKEYIIIHGGRNDQMKPSVLNSMHFLNLRNLNWIKVGGQKPPYRYSHAITVVNDEIVILGGKGLEGLCKQVYVQPFEEVFEYV